MKYLIEFTVPSDKPQKFMDVTDVCDEIVEDQMEIREDKICKRRICFLPCFRVSTIAPSWLSDKRRNCFAQQSKMFRTWPIQWTKCRQDWCPVLTLPYR